MAEIYVTTTADSGAGSLRQAYYAANGGDVILFDETVFPAGTLTAIYLSSQLAVAKEIEIDGDGRVALDGQNSVRCLVVAASAHIKNLTVRNGATTNGAGVHLNGGTPTLTNCVVENCNASSACGGVYFINSVVATLNNCIVDTCTAGTNGGGVYFNNTSQATLNDCKIFGCSSDGSGGGLIGASDSQAVLNRCNIQVCRTANYGGAAYIFGAATVSFVDCTTSNNTSDTAARRGVVVGGTATVSFTNAQVEALLINPGTTATIADGLSTVGTLTLVANADGAPTVTFADGAALSVTSGASIPSGTIFTSETRGYLAAATGLDFSAATLTNVVLCEYGAGVTAFRATKDAATWTATDSTISVLLEKRVDETWTTVAQTTGTSYSGYFPGATLRIFDGAQFVTTIALKLHAWLEYTQAITVATATAKAYETTVQSAPRYKIKKGYVMASQYYNRGEAPVFFARIEDSETSAIVPKSSVSSISYTAYRVTTSWSTEKRTPVEGHENVAVDLAAYLDALVTDDPRWTQDSVGYNFIFEPDTTVNPIFPDAGNYVVVVTINFEGANPAPISYEVAVK